MQDKWIFYKEVDFTDQTILQYHIDTRDFHCNALTKKSLDVPDVNSLSKYKDRFFYTAEEVKDLLDRYFIDSGGPGKARVFGLDHRELHNWNLKYLRIHRVNDKFVICNRYHRALSKDKTGAPVMKPDYQN